MTTDRILLLIPYLPLLLVTIFVLVYWYQMKKELRMFSWFLFLSTFIQSVSLILYLSGINNMPLLHLYVAIGGGILILFYRDLFSSFLSSRIFNSLAIIYLLFNFTNSLFLEGIYSFNSNALTVQGVIMICLSLTYFNISLTKNKFNPEIRKSENWINSGIFVYFASNLLLHYFGDYLTSGILKGGPFRELWMLHSCIAFTTYTLFLVGVIKIVQKRE